MKLSCRALLAVIAATPFLPGQVLVVDPAGAGHTRTIQAAVDLATRTGTVILVRAGNYPEGVRIVRKAVTLIGEAGVTIASLTADGVTIEDHPHEGQTVLARLRIGATMPLAQGLLALTVRGGGGRVACDTVTMTRPVRARAFAGSLTLAQCTVTPSTMTLQGADTPLPGVELEGVSPAIVIGCTLRGSMGRPDRDAPGPGMPALVARASDVELVRPRLSGGPGGQFLRFPGLTIEGDGGDALELQGSTVRMHGAPGSSVTGFTPTFFSFSTPRGGAGVVLRSASLEHGSVTVTGGGGPLPGPAFDADPASRLVQVPVPVATVQRLGIYRIGRATTLEVFGPANAIGALVISTRHVFEPLPFGPLFVDPFRIGLSLPVVTGADGTSRHPVSVPSDTATIGHTFVAQPAILDAAGLTLGGPDVGVVMW